MDLRRMGGLAATVSWACLLAACVTPQPPPATPGLTELLDQPAERALFEAMRQYDDAQYAAAEAALQKALAAGLRSRRDQATAHKLIAFISCSSERLAACEQAFRAAHAADPAFALSKPEAGHPLWGPVYRRIVAR